MREELIRVLNFKLNDVNGDIEALENLNEKIETEKEKSSFAEKILNIFKENDHDNIMNFAKIEKEDFERATDLAGDGIKNTFNSGSCNYDGLVYLINGINSGVSLTLTDEQKEGIDSFIKSLTEKKKEFDSAVDGYTLVKSRYEINDVKELENKKDEYQKIIDGLDRNDYVQDTDLLMEAVKFSSLSPEETVDLLAYVLQYNADVYKSGKPVRNEEVKEEPKEEVQEETTDENRDQDAFELPEENDNVDIDYTNEDNDFHFNQINNSDLFELPNITFEEEAEENKEEPIEDDSSTPIENNDIASESFEKEETEEQEDFAPEYQEYTPYVESNEDVQIPDELTYVPEIDDETVEDNNDQFEPEIEEPVEEVAVQEINEIEDNNIDNDFKDIIDGQEDYDENSVQEEEKSSTRELQKIFSKYGIEENIVLNELIDGNVNEYQNILDSLKDSGVLEIIKGNRELLLEILLYSNMDVVDKVLRVVRDDLSVDDEDYAITLKIVIDTIPSVFVKEGGNYDNFIKNIELFKEQEINLINLFDFSKEVFIADNDSIKKNLDIVNKYDLNLDYKNAKYYLLIPNIEDRLDYYIESVYPDKEKGETFDGINYVKDYAAKLNVVTDETIKRLRYASENGRKVFGSKPGSLTGEITNLKVNALDISDEYMNKFFNNEFANLTGDEVREYIKLIHNSSNVGDYSDELDKLNSYKDGLRYDIDGIKVSYNKVARNYSILRSYSIDSKKALQFAVCYNLVITKEEYDKLNDLLDKIGGNV